MKLVDIGEDGWDLGQSHSVEEAAERHEEKLIRSRHESICWHGKSDVRVDNVPNPKIHDPRDAIIKITRSGICQSDLHLLNGLMPTMEKGDILGHEPMGIVEIGKGVSNLKKGDRVVVPFTISCGTCYFCQKTLFSCCDNSNPNRMIAEKAMGHSPGRAFRVLAYARKPHGQAEYLRVPFADVGPLKIESDLPDDKVLFLSDIFPTGYMAAENAEIEPGDTVAVWGCGPVAQFAIKSAWMFKAGRVIAIDRVPERLAMAAKDGQAETIDFSKQDVYQTLQEMTKGRGPDRCIDAVGCEAHAAGTLQGCDGGRGFVSGFAFRPNAFYYPGHNVLSKRRDDFCSRRYTGVADKLPLEHS